MMKKEDGFLGELRSYAMKLHTREQAPKEGQAEAPKEQPKWEPTTECYLQYLVDSKCVYDTLEKAVAEAEEGSALVAFKATGLERGEALARDIAWFTSAEGDGLGLEAPAVSEVGSSYAATLAGMARDNVPAFMCHYYNTYFAHTAGGRMIGKQLSDAILDKKKLEFYKWDGVLKEHMDGVRKEINDMAEKWTQVCLQYISKSLHLSFVSARSQVKREGCWHAFGTRGYEIAVVWLTYLPIAQEEKQACLEETGPCFKEAGKVLRLLAGQ